MSLATVIRLEFAYPGVGILAGDSLQYLSVCTAHGVIMVFFMIMPAIFGGFVNFLLPTQLGVHDVAFPRLNSAAFWFFPGGLIMLCQLVCTDRRYARMNCFNIRELQGILKRKFFTDLVNSHDHRNLLDQTMIGLRFKVNQGNNTDLDVLSFYNYGTHVTSVGKHFNLSNNHTIYGSGAHTTPVLGSLDLFFINMFRELFWVGHITSPPTILISTSTFINYTLPILSFNFSSWFSTVFVHSSLLAKIVSNNFSFLNIKMEDFSLSTVPYPNRNTPTFTTRDNQAGLLGLGSGKFSENTTFQRVTRFNNLLINYDYKTGHYLGDWDKNYPYLLTSFIEVARGIRKPS